MKVYLALFGAFVATVANSAAQSQRPPANLSPEEREVFQAELRREDATNRGDRSEVERLTDDDFILVGARGITDRATRIANSGQAASGTLRTKAALTYGDVRIKIYGDTAVLTALRSWTWEPDGQTVNERTVKLWVKRPDGWKIVLTTGVPVASK